MLQPQVIVAYGWGAVAPGLRAQELALVTTAGGAQQCAARRARPAEGERSIAESAIRARHPWRLVQMMPSGGLQPLASPKRESPRANRGAALVERPGLREAADVLSMLGRGKASDWEQRGSLLRQRIAIETRGSLVPSNGCLPCGANPSEPRPESNVRGHPARRHTPRNRRLPSVEPE